MFLVTMNGPHLHNMYPGTVCPESSDPFFSNLLYIMGNYFLDIQYFSWIGLDRKYFRSVAGYLKDLILDPIRDDIQSLDPTLQTNFTKGSRKK